MRSSFTRLRRGHHIAASFARFFHQRAFTNAIAVQPILNESKNDFITRCHEKVMNKLCHPRYANHILLMHYSTRFAKIEETLKNAASRHTMEQLERVGLSMTVEQAFFPGHCLSTYIDKKGKINQDYTFSLRPDTQQPPLQKNVVVALDERLPTSLSKKCHIYSATHTTLSQEIKKWAHDAFYTWYVHPTRPIYQLHCLLLAADEKSRDAYFNAVKKSKTEHHQYSLFDHYDTETNTLQSAVNCTKVASIFEDMQSTCFDGLLGNNPTPQLVARVIKNSYFNHCTDENDEALNAAYFRKMTSTKCQLKTHWHQGSYSRLYSPMNSQSPSKTLLSERLITLSPL